jgi:DNA-binding CsgD family transcriptional regulator/predicted enzyme related to lactoylglutathione lyase
MVLRRGRGRPPFTDVLTPAEWRTVQLVRHGLGDSAIARRLGVSRDAARFHVANALSKLALADRRALRLWRGIPRASALHSETIDMHAPLVLGALGQVARGVRDIGESERFYREVLQLPHLYTFGTLAFFDLGGVRLFLEQADAGALEGGCLYFRVPDIRVAHDALQARGAHFVSAPHMIHRHADGTEEWMAFFDDPEGRPLAIMQQVAPG